MSEPKAWADDMGEISGFGGSYEAGCRAMVLAGIRWIDEHPDADPHFKGFKNVYGMVMEDNPDAQALTDAIMNADVEIDGRTVKARTEATGAMHHAAVNHVFAYKRLGWDEYQRQLREHNTDERSA